MLACHFRKGGEKKKKAIVDETCFLSVHRLLNVLEVIAPFKHFNKLREFVQMKLPPGFPVKLGKIMIMMRSEGKKKKNKTRKRNKTTKLGP